MSTSRGSFTCFQQNHFHYYCYKGGHVSIWGWFAECWSGKCLSCLTKRYTYDIYMCVFVSAFLCVCMLGRKNECSRKGCSLYFLKKFLIFLFFNSKFIAVNSVTNYVWHTGLITLGMAGVGWEHSQFGGHKWI